MKCSIIFVVLAIIFGRSLSQRSEVVESQHECGGYCYGAVKPVLEYLAILQKRVESCEAKQPADTLSKIVQMEEKLATLERQVAVQQELEKISRNGDNLSKLALMDEKLDVLRKQMATKQELENTLSKFALMDAKLEAFKTQTATQQQLENTFSIITLLDEKLETLKNQTATLPELENTLAKFALMDEKLETLRKQMATKQELENISHTADLLSKFAQIDEKLEAFGRQMAMQQELIKIIQPADILSKIALMDAKLGTLETQMATKQELEKNSKQSADNLEALRNQTATQLELENTFSKIAAMDEKLETLKNQTATQQELEKSSKQSEEALSKLALMDEKLEALRNQTATKQDLERVFIKTYFKKIGSKYYYIENELRLNWHDALKKCHDMGAHLASLQSNDEMEAVDTFLKTDSSYWIDLNDLKTEGEFISATTGTKGTFFHWRAGEPDNWHNLEHCVDLYSSSSSSLQMDDDRCEIEYSFICEASFD